MTTPRVLLVNGNSRTDLTDRMGTMARASLGALASIETMTIADSPPYIATRTQADAAARALAPAVLARLRGPGVQPDAVMLACFGEPGLWTLRAGMAVPVTGMLEASMATALQLGRRIGILVSGSDWPAQIDRLLALYGIAGRVSRVTAVPDAAMADDAAIWQPALNEAVAQQAMAGDLDVLILGGGPLAGRAAALDCPDGLPIIDAFTATLFQTLALARTRQGRSAIAAPP